MIINKGFNLSQSKRKVRGQLLSLALLSAGFCSLAQPAFAMWGCCWHAPGNVVTDSCGSQSIVDCAGPCTVTTDATSSYCYHCSNPFTTCNMTVPVLGTRRIDTGICNSGSISGRGCACDVTKLGAVAPATVMSCP